MDHVKLGALEKKKNASRDYTSKFHWFKDQSYKEIDYIEKLIRFSSLTKYPKITEAHKGEERLDTSSKNNNRGCD